MTILRRAVTIPVTEISMITNPPKNDAPDKALVERLLPVLRVAYSCGYTDRPGERNWSDNVDRLTNDLRAALSNSPVVGEDAVRAAPNLLSNDEERGILADAEQLWADLQSNNLGGYSGINRPFYILYEFKRVIEKYGNRDVGLTWSKDDIDALPSKPTFIDTADRQSVPLNFAGTEAQWVNTADHREAVARWLCAYCGGDPDQMSSESETIYDRDGKEHVGPLWQLFSRDVDELASLIAVPDGMVLVPREPTEAMIEAAASFGGEGGYNRARGEIAVETWREMIAAATGDA